jgi:hypothetical protein
MVHAVPRAVGCWGKACTLAPYDISKGNIIHELYSH